MQHNVKKTLLLTISLVMALFIILSLCINVIQPTMKLNIEEIRYNRYANGVDLDIIDNGMMLLSFRPQISYSLETWNWLPIILGTISLVILLCGIASIIFSILLFIKFESEKMFSNTIIIIAFITSVLYFVEGIIYLKFLQTFESYSHMYTTLAYIPLIVQLVLFFIYILCKKLIPSSLEYVTTQVQNRSNEKNMLENNAKNNNTLFQLIVLEQCKKLLDSGVITQEEFDSKKKELLY